MLDTVKLYKNSWEEKERLNLETDVTVRVESIEKDKKYKEVYEPLD